MNEALPRWMLRKVKKGSWVSYQRLLDRENGSCGVNYDDHYNPKIKQRKGNAANLCGGDR